MNLFDPLIVIREGYYFFADEEAARVMNSRNKKTQDTGVNNARYPVF